jgi:hypothetical protein
MSFLGSRTHAARQWIGQPTSDPGQARTALDTVAAALRR